MATKIHPGARREYSEYLTHRTSDLHDEAKEAEEMALVAQETHEHDWQRDRDDWLKYCGAEAWQRNLSADQWLDLMLEKHYFTRDELEDEYQQRKRDEMDDCA